MLATSEQARVYHNQVKSEFALNDLIVVGAVTKDNGTIFNSESLSEIKALTDKILLIEGVLKKDVNSLSTIDNIEQAGEATIRFEWLMAKAPDDQLAASSIEAKTDRLPFVVNSLVSGDKKAATIYVPIKDKNESYRISNEIRELISSLTIANNYHITGLPVAEDTFGVEMFIQMGISAPAAAAVIYLLMLFFFRSASLVAAPMIVAMATVIIIMGSMIGAGYTVHIMSSMIPIFLMPIAVVDSVHLMSEFADRYTPGADAKGTIKSVTSHLFQPMLFTSITSAAGFFSLALTPIPPVQIFGIFVGAGILLAFVVTILFIPAYISRMSQKQLLAMQNRLHQAESGTGFLAKALPIIGRFSVSRSKTVIILALAITTISIIGIFKIQINDNPVRWFKESHDIRVADRVLNEHFAGTYDAHLVFEFTGKPAIRSSWQAKIESILNKEYLSATAKEQISSFITEQKSDVSYQEFTILLDDLAFDENEQGNGSITQMIEITDQAFRQQKQFLSPEALHYIDNLQQHLLTTGLVGKSNSVVDLIKTVNRELRSGKDSDFSLPNSQAGVAQTLLQYQSSHRPHDLWHFITPDYDKTLVWLQMKSGDNQDMSAVVDAVNRFIKENPPQENISINWAGKAYLNLVWQEKMVTGMFDSLTSAFVIVFIMMVLLFRSVIYGFLAMLPLSITIVFMYGMIGLMGKYYDMPIAVLSALTLGLSVDFAIHFIERFRSIYAQTSSWSETINLMFEEPARAISRNALVIALGFTPLLLAPLVPYITVGAFLATIMAVSGLVTIMVLPASLNMLRRFLFKTS